MRNDIHILSEDEILERLKELPGWEYKDARNVSDNSNISGPLKVQQSKEGLSGNKISKEFMEY